MCGDFGTAASLVAERAVVNEVTGIQQSATCDLRLAAYRGRSAEAEPLYAAIVEDAEARGEGLAVHLANWAAAVLRNSQGRYAEALAAAESATGEACRSISTQLVLPELIEAAMRTGRADLASDALDRLSATALEGSDWAKGLEARSRALVSEGPDAERCYAGAIQRLGRTPLRPELARAHLLYGEWLRRENRRLDARHQLSNAYSLFTDIGAEAFAERARRELLTTGEKARKREVDTQSQLTPQEKHIIRLARDGAHQRRDRSGAVHQHPHRRMAHAQGVRQTRHHLPPGPPPHRAPARPAHAVGLEPFRRYRCCGRLLRVYPAMTRGSRFGLQPATRALTRK